MSLINEMLQDLEKRRASPPERSDVPRHVRVMPSREGDARRNVIIVGLAIAALGAGVSWYVYDQMPQRIKSAPALASPVTAARAEVASAATEVVNVNTNTSRTLEAPPQPLPVQSVIPPALKEETSEPKRKRIATEPRVEPPRVSKAAHRNERERAPQQPINISLRMDSIPVERSIVSESRVTPSPEPAHIDRKVRELTPAQLAENDYRAGASLLNQGRVAEAQERFAAALVHSASHSGARQALFGLLVQAKKTSEAEQLLSEGLRIDPKQPGFAMALARLQVDRDDSTAAMETLQNSVQFAGTSPDYYAFLAALLQRQGRHAQAVEMYQAALALAPRSGVWLMGLGISLQALGRANDAQNAFKRARATDTLRGELQAFVDQRLKQLQ
jgi:MSHA biogenesis protein MshN